MEEITLTKEASNLLSTIYTEYKKRLKSGISREDAANFDSSKAIHEKLVSTQKFDDIDSLCAELRHAGLLCGMRADGYEYHVTLSVKGISYCQTAFPRAASKVFDRLLEWLQAIVSLRPW